MHKEKRAILDRLLAEEKAKRGLLAEPKSAGTPEKSAGKAQEQGGRVRKGLHPRYIYKKY
jgi:hypothetical protein